MEEVSHLKTNESYFIQVCAFLRTRLLRRHGLAFDCVARAGSGGTQLRAT